jgi:hypothetical protein
MQGKTEGPGENPAPMPLHFHGLTTRAVPNVNPSLQRNKPV